MTAVESAGFRIIRVTDPAPEGRGGAPVAAQRAGAVAAAQSEDQQLSLTRILARSSTNISKILAKF